MTSATKDVCTKYFGKETLVTANRRREDFSEERYLSQFMKDKESLFCHRHTTQETNGNGKNYLDIKVIREVV